ncbi:hypothetical protein J3R30DRAFT_3739858 [Lentinula aciculospora]|uniref:Uncharacterized protein n=1 Tax=Lentinula aciculospora TaxID=153920 RepID=A0A9W8ZVI5_9AGAR|nr:hypothetical protein J3R30DRAFT_3739858 [Lentinula aciculospora]
MSTAISMPTTISTVSSMASSSSQSSDYSRVVRFDDECVLIPELQPIKRPIIITKSYILPPLWRRKPSDEESFEEPSSPVLRVPIPNFKAKPARSSSRGRDPTSPLSPCLVHRSPSSSSFTEGVAHRKLERRPSLPNSPVLDNSGKPLPTIPLRSCCPDCVSITEESLKEGEAWVEKFTRGARRRRSSSGESDCGFAPVASNHQGHKDIAVVRVGTSASINVDEVDKRRRSRDIDAVPEFMETFSPSTSPIAPHVPSAIIEEDEDQLFPLPSPRRSPNSSPVNSSSGSPMPSPNTSTSHLSSASPTESAKIPEEGILAKSLMRKGRCEKGLLTPEADAGPTLSPAAISVYSPEALSLSSSASSATFVDLSPTVSQNLPTTPPSVHHTSHSRSPVRRSEPHTKQRHPSFGATMLRATSDVLRGVSFNTGTLHGGMSV